MKNTVLRYGTYSAITICTLFLSSWYLLNKLSFINQEIFGYASMIVSLLFIFFGIKQYRDKENNGLISFGKAITIGFLITLIASFAFGLLDVIYVKYLNPDFMTIYYTTHIEEMRTNMTSVEFEVALEKLEAEKELFSNPFINFLIMFITVTMIGSIISIISSLILQRKN